MSSVTASNTLTFVDSEFGPVTISDHQRADISAEHDVIAADAVRKARVRPGMRFVLEFDWAAPTAGLRIVTKTANDIVRTRGPVMFCT